MSEQYADEAILAVKKDDRKARDLRAKGVSPFLDGFIVTVEYKNEDGNDDFKYVFFHNGSKRVWYYAYHVVEVVRDHLKFSFWHRMAYSFLSIGGITGLLAVLIVLAMIAMTFLRIEISENWWRIFTLVIGFYFGNITSKK
jgi:hypothetical protein